MMSCLSTSRGYRLDHEKEFIGNACDNGPSSVISDTKSKSSISSTGSDITSSLLVSRKKPRTRRRRPQEIYNEAAAALSAIYPKIFSPKNCSPHPKRFEKLFAATRKIIEPLRSADEAELLHEVPTLISRVREVEDTELLFNQWGGRDPVLSNRESKYPNFSANNYDCNRSPLPSDSNSHLDVSTPSISPSWECFLDSNDEEIDGGIMSTIMGTTANPESPEIEGNLGLFGLGMDENVKESSSFNCSAIRSLRRTSDCMICPIFDYSLKISGENENNTMAYDAPQRLKLQLNYQDVLNAWSDRGSLYTDELQQPQTVPSGSSFNPIAATSMNFDLVLDVGFWRSADENGIGINGQVDEDGSMLSGSGVREASVLRYKEKRRMRLFSKKIRYQVRKLNAERRPRMKGRFVRRLADL